MVSLIWHSSQVSNDMGRSNQPHTKCATVIFSSDQEVGLVPVYAYLALCDLAKPWIVNPTLVDFHGELG